MVTMSTHAQTPYRHVSYSNMREVLVICMMTLHISTAKIRNKAHQSQLGRKKEKHQRYVPTLKNKNPMTIEQFNH